LATTPMPRTAGNAAKSCFDCRYCWHLGTSSRWSHWDGWVCFQGQIIHAVQEEQLQPCGGHASECVHWGKPIDLNVRSHDFFITSNGDFVGWREGDHWFIIVVPPNKKVRHAWVSVRGAWMLIPREIWQQIAVALQPRLELDGLGYPKGFLRKENDVR